MSTILEINPWAAAQIEIIVPLGLISVSGLQSIASATGGTVLLISPVTDTTVNISAPIGTILASAFTPKVNVITYTWFDITATVTDSVVGGETQSANAAALLISVPF